MARPGRVLVIDDDRRIVDLLVDVLTMDGYEVLSADNAGDGLMLLASTTVDVVLLDVRMPRVDGYTALRRIRQGYPDVPVIMVTGNADHQMARETLKQGAFDYIAKPIDLAHLAKTVEAAIAHGAV